MSPKTKKFIASWLINTLAVAVACGILRNGIHYDTLADLLIASLLLGILNAFVRPILLLMALPLLIFTLGLFIFVINALLLYLVAWILPGFHVDSFWWAFGGAFIISIVSLFLNTVTGTGNTRARVHRGRRPPNPGPPNSDRGGDGPVIDV